MYTRIQQYQDDLVFPPLPCGTSDTASSFPSSSSSSSSYATSFSSRRSTSAATAAAAAAALTVAAKVREQPAKSSTPSSLSLDAQEVILSLMQRDPMLRMSARNVLLSDWLCDS